MKTSQKFFTLLRSICFLYILALFYIQTAKSQDKNKAAFNFDFESISQSEAFPERWSKFGPGYKITTDSLQKFSGKYSVLVQASDRWKNGQSGSAWLEIPAIYQGKEIELSGFLKLQDVQNGNVGLMLRIDGKNGPLQFNNMQDQKIQGTVDWKNYSIKLPLPNHAEAIAVAVLHTGTGQVWVDDLQLKIDGRDVSQVPVKEQIMFRADLDTAFSRSSEIKIAALNNKITDDLVVVGKIWGFLKYYHPEVAAGNLNWDNQLFRIMPTILSSKSKQERNEVILAFIEGLGSFKQGKATRTNRGSKTKLQADLNWIDNTVELGERLSSRLVEIESALRPAKHYYVGESKGAGNPEFKNEREYVLMTNPDDGFRLLSLFRYWNMIEYYFPYKNLINEDWNIVLREFVPKFLAASDQRSYTLVCLELIARIHDTHANIMGNKYLSEVIVGKSRLPFQAKFIEDRLTVTGFYSDTLQVKQQVHLGDRIVKIDGEPVEVLVKKLLPYTPASNYSTQLRSLAQNLLRGNSDTFDLQIMRGGKLLDLTLPTVSFKSLDRTIDYNPQRDKPGYYVLDENIGYLFPAKYKNVDLPGIREMFADTKGIIVDMRCYPSDPMVFTFGEYIKSKPSTFVRFTKPNYEKPGDFTFVRAYRNGGSLGKKFRRKVVVIVNERTQSQAEYTTMALQSAGNVTVIGSTTAGADGNVSSIILPGGIKTMISGLGIYYPDGAETQRVGVKIDLPIKPTLEGIISGRDELLEKAKELILMN